MRWSLRRERCEAVERPCCKTGAMEGYFILLRCGSIDAALSRAIAFSSAIALLQNASCGNNELPHRKACALSGKTATVTQDCSIALGLSSENRSQDQMLADMPMMQRPWLAAVREKAHGS